MENTNNTISDVALVSRAIEGEENAFAELVDRHLQAVYAFSMRYVRDTADADDVAQETFVRAWKNFETFDTSRNLKTWLFTIAKHAALDMLKKKKPVAFSRIMETESELESFLAPYIASGEIPENIVDQKILKGDMGEALAKLPAAYRAVLAMRYEENLKFREIASSLGTSIDTIKSRHRRGLALLRKSWF
jgi:RNA polymerase sigma-70 factor (ECF subfamily)